MANFLKIKTIASEKNISLKEVADYLGITPTGLSKIIRENSTKTSTLEKIAIKLKVPVSIFFDESCEYTKEQTSRHLIPFYEDVRSIGGTDTIAETGAEMHPSEMIDAGDWFPDATAAMRHYGDSMAEYPSGCILALRRVQDRRLLMWGKNYVIETSEYRVTKKLKYCENRKCILAYSTNTEKEPDGSLLYPPFEIPTDAVINFDLVLGCVTKEYSNGPIAVK